MGTPYPYPITGTLFGKPKNVVPGEPSQALVIANENDRAIISGKDDKDTHDDIWFHPTLIDGLHWNQSYPYQLLVVEPEGEGVYRQRGDWKFTLPVSPTDVTITTPYAIQTTVTQGGIVEEHNAAPLRSIEIAGSTGVFPVRPSAGQAKRAGVFGGIFAGTIASFGRTVAALTDLVGIDKLAPNLIPKNLISDMNSTDSLLKGSGYYQIRTMARFIEAYANLKLTTTGKKAHLALALWKDEAVYLVTPVAVRIKKSANSPLEYLYQLSFTAFSRVEINGGGPKPTPVTITDPQDPNLLATVLNKLQDVRRVLQNARKTIEAVGGDAHHILEIVREAILITKDAMGVTLALIDVPAAIVKDAADTIIAARAASKAVKDFANTGWGDAKNKDWDAAQKDWARIDDSLVPEIRDRGAVGTFLGAQSTRAEASGASSSGSGRIKPSLDIFDNPDEHAGFLESIDLDNYDFPPSVRDKIEDETARVRGLTQNDLKERRQALRDAGATFEDLSGAGDPTFAATYGRPPPAESKPMSINNVLISSAIQDAATAYSGLVGRSPKAADASTLAGLTGFARHAADSGVPFKIPRSKFPVPFPYGMTLEQMALLYLGSPDRVSEIIALNGLRRPYVDEVGSQLPLLAPGAGRDVVVADSPDLFVGQTAWIESVTKPRVRRRVVGVERRNGQATVTLDGADDLDQFSTVDRASLHTFLPGTVNSQQLIFIPSDSEPDGTFRVSGIADTAVFDPLMSAGGVDLLLTPQNDLVVTSDGDGRWATGLTAITQLFRILMTLRRGTLLHHPTRGLPLRPGVSIADSSADDVVDAVRSTLSPEPAFAMVRSISVIEKPPVVQVQVNVEVSGTQVTLPLSVDTFR